MDDAFIASVMRECNSNLAATKPSLMELKDGDVEGYTMRDGSTIVVSESQINLIWDACDDAERLRLRIPIYVSTDIGSEVSSWKIEGNVEASVVSKILGKKVYREGYLRLYHPDLKELQRKIPDAIIITFRM